MTLKDCCGIIMLGKKGILKKQVAITPGEAGLVWRLNRYFPWLVRWMTDRQYEQARRQLE